MNHDLCNLSYKLEKCMLDSQGYSILMQEGTTINLVYLKLQRLCLKEITGQHLIYL